ncbi:hypothetical protein HYO65_gp179 [Tenacibaculum phage PTm1]|uniref:BRCT domain-containing protein n=2 Tax=Shirahamavirus PTm1 TaxID=2846435 RepID=A0A5S9ERL7_9CAUD|nr:hypothetical protein HYO65_gp179 [Tenacibaculum phage PTm1]BBI90571.1 hypothetical protein [Tenacibaculum phage PTm1]BBI90879.1 hypothetical protein [Tenacibaculum phage PTm5]
MSIETFYIGGKELTKEQLKSDFNIPTDNIDIVGVNLVSTNADDFIRRAKFLEVWKCFPIDGFADKTYFKIYDGLFTGEDKQPLDIFNDCVVNLNTLSNIGLGEKTSIKFVDGINGHKNNKITIDKVVRMMVVDGAGDSTIEEFAHYLCDNPYDFSGKTKVVIDELKGSSGRIDDTIEYLEEYGIVVESLAPREEASADDITFVMTGRPQACGFEGTKAVFKSQLPSNWTEVKKLTTDTTYLITGDLNSTSSKTKTALKNGTKIITYMQALELCK